jgi:hypothetical protein
MTANERAAIVLQLVVESIQAIVNHEVLSFSPGSVNIQASFRSPSQAAMANVLLADMLEPVDKTLLDFEGSLLDAMIDVSNSAPFGAGDEVVRLRAAVKAWSDWLEQDIDVEVWFPSIDTNTRLNLKRREFIAICGNISKHNMSRLTRNAKRLSTLLKRNGTSVDWIDALRALDDFQVRFHDDILAYHSTTIAELLNNLRWAIQEYLAPEFERSYRPPTSVGDPRYSYHYPAGLEDTYAKSRYWDLMNSVRAGPWIPRFTGTPSLKGNY